MKNIWKTWQELNKLTIGKKVVFFGKSEDWAVKTLRAISFPIEYIIDNNTTLQGTTFHELKIYSPNKLKEVNKDDIFIILTSGGYESIIPQLTEYGFEAGKHFCCTPVMNNLKIISDIHNHQQKVLISSPDHAIYDVIDGKRGGGLYLYDLQAQDYERVFSGCFHQIAETEDNFYIIHEMDGVHIFDYNFKLLEKFAIPEGSKGHGIAYHKERNLIFVACSGLDMVTVHDGNTGKIVEKIQMSGKYDRLQLEQHHINDLAISGDSLFVSCFSVGGHCPKGVYDGGIIEFNIENPEQKHLVVRDLWMPHSPRFIGGDLCFAESQRGHLYKTNTSIIGSFHGFTRGIAHDGQYFYVGQSENRYFDRLKGIANNISLNAGFYLFDEESKAAKLFPMPTLRQIHDLVIFKEKGAKK